MNASQKLSSLVNDFSTAMIDKLVKKLNEGRKGWDESEWSQESVVRCLISHIEKGDPVDVANLAAFWWHKGATEMEVGFIFNFIWDALSKSANRTAQTRGFWHDYSDGEKIALMHSELSEALEALRHKNPPSEKIEGFSNLEEELADLVIRVMDYGEQKNLRLSEAILAKMLYNDTRPYKHGKQF